MATLPPMKIRKLTPEEARSVRGETFSPEMQERLKSYRKWLGYVRHEPASRWRKRVITFEGTQQDAPEAEAASQPREAG